MSLPNGLRLSCGLRRPQSRRKIPLSLPQQAAAAGRQLQALVRQRHMALRLVIAHAIPDEGVVGNGFNHGWKGPLKTRTSMVTPGHEVLAATLVNKV